MVDWIRKEWIRTDPLVVGFVKELVDRRNVEPSMYPVDAIICEDEEAFDHVNLSFDTEEARIRLTVVLTQ